MERFNYHHLLYFWVVAREGSIARACAELSLAQPTISGQIRELEQSLGMKVFTRVGRNLVLTDAGRLVYSYAEEIFKLGQELQSAIKGRAQARPLRFEVGIVDVLPKLVAYRLLESSLRLPERVQLVCREDRPDKLLAELSLHGLDVVLSDTPVSPLVRVRAYSHLLGECGITFLATRELAARFRPDFPRSLNGAPLLLPTENTSMRRALDQWMTSQRVSPEVCGEFADSGLLKSFGRAGVGVVAMPTAIESDVAAQFGLEVIGREDSVRFRCYAITVERRLKHPAVIALSETARNGLFSPRPEGEQ
jgi:LysR family transcriptional activator of nhaA